MTIQARKVLLANSVYTTSLQSFDLLAIPVSKWGKYRDVARLELVRSVI
jgi:hypothetical protein